MHYKIEHAFLRTQEIADDRKNAISQKSSLHETTSLVGRLVEPVGMTLLGAVASKKRKNILCEIVDNLNKFRNEI
jgi:hypothetical protein